jgi:glycosyltransferase involved in cell wall biosynthesis
MMRVRIVVPTYFPATAYGGPTFSIHNTAQALARDGIDIAVSTTDADRPNRLDVRTDAPVPFEERYRVRYYREQVTDRFSWDFARSISRDVVNADIVHLQDVFSSYALLTLWHASRHNKPVVLSPRGVFSKWALAAGRSAIKKAWISLLFKPLLARVRNVVWHATSAQESLDVQQSLPGARVEIIPNGVDLAVFKSIDPLTRSEWLARFAPELSSRYGEAVVLISMGRVHPVKGFDIAMQSLSDLVAAGLNCVFVIAGKDDGARQQLERLAKKLGIAERLAFAGEVLDQTKIQFLAGGDIFLFPSRSENFGLACLEALASGTPTVASRETPWAEIAEYGAGKWVTNDNAGLTAGVQEILADSQTDYAGNARKLAERYGYAAVAAAFRTCFTKLAG